MQRGDGRFRIQGGVGTTGKVSERQAEDDDLYRANVEENVGTEEDEVEAEDEVDEERGSDGGPGAPQSIRDLQRRRRDATRLRSDMQALLATPEDDEEDSEPQAGPPLPAPASVFVVFRGAKWEDPDGALRESDSIAGVYSSEDAARRAAAEMSRGQTEREDAWYQPYPVEQ